MNVPIVLSHEFVKAIPDELAERTLYVSMDYATVVHRCCCGCGREVVTPLSPTDWKLIYDGISVSLYPSIGNWSFECQSHYWVEKSRLLWVGGGPARESRRAGHMIAEQRRFITVALCWDPRSIRFLPVRARVRDSGLGRLECGILVGVQCQQ